MIDFTNCPLRKKAYSGANGNKISIVYQDEIYMLKFPSIAAKNKNLSYSNSCISEYIGCKIYKNLGIPVQEVLLGTYQTKKGTKIVVACKDFAIDGKILQDFAALKNQIIDSGHNGYGTELEDILNTFDSQTVIDKNVLSQRFWDMFIVDSLLGNFDRHNGNWGFLYDPQMDEITLAPVYDCGSSLFPQADETVINSVLTETGALHHRIYNYPPSAIRENDKRINYFQFISSCKNEECNAALKRIVPSIDMEKIHAIIEETPFITQKQKAFYYLILETRKKLILDFSYKKLQELENDLELEERNDP